MSSKPNQSITGDSDILSTSLRDMSSPQPTSTYPRIETSYVHLPDNKLIITRHITRDLLRKPDFVPAQEREADRDELSVSNRLIDGGNIDSAKDLLPSQSFRAARRGDTRKTQASVLKLEDEDMDTVYVTNITNKPFRIASLGDFDPEEDFRDASLDIADSESDSRAGSHSALSRRGIRVQPNSVHKERDTLSSRDINFGDPEADSMFYDASETDEVTFDTEDDPYQTDLEAELHAQAYDQPGQVSQDEHNRNLNGEASDVEGRDLIGNRRATRQQNRKSVHEGNPLRQGVNRRRDESDDDESESRWLNDGADDMEIPSRGHQESVLKKAALAAEARRDEDGTGSDGRIDQVEEQPVQEELTESKPIDQPAQSSGNEGDQRMPNADYLKDDMKTDDLDYKA